MHNMLFIGHENGHIISKMVSALLLQVASSKQVTFRCVKNITPQLIKSLKKALEPVLTDVRIDWFLPENLEAFLSPSEIPPLYPGDRLIGYCTLYDMTNFKAKKTEVCVSASANFPLACKKKEN